MRLSIVVEAAPALAAALLIVLILPAVGFSRGYSDWVWLFLAIVIGFRNVRAIVRDVRAIGRARREQSTAPRPSA